MRTMDGTKQINRGYSESIGARFRREQLGPIADWFFVGRLTSKDPGQYARHAEMMASYLSGVCTGAVLFGKIPDWKLVRIYSTPGREALAERVRSFFEAELSIVVPLPAIRPVTFLPAEVSQPGGEPSSLPFSLDEALRDVFMSREEFERILADWRRKKNLVLEGPPGVGKTFLARRLAYALLGERDERRVAMVQFHQSTSYEDFIRGWRPGEGDERFELVDGVFHEFCIEAGRDPTRGYVFIIDEINRAHLSKVFGELLMLIEADKRGPEHAIPLAYRRRGDREDDRFHVPANVYVLGMMNTADRSLAMVDYALRRRFAFHELRPAFAHPGFGALLERLGVEPSVIRTIRGRLASLNHVIVSDAKNLGSGFEVGHSFFCPAGPVDDSEAWYRAVVDSELAPLLREYWFDDEDEARKHVAALRAPIGPGTIGSSGTGGGDEDRAAS